MPALALVRATVSFLYTLCCEMLCSCSRPCLVMCTSFHLQSVHGSLLHPPSCCIPAAFSVALGIPTHLDDASFAEHACDVIADGHAALVDMALVSTSEVRDGAQG